MAEWLQALVAGLAGAGQGYVSATEKKREEEERKRLEREAERRWRLSYDQGVARDARDADQTAFEQEQVAYNTLAGGAKVTNPEMAAKWRKRGFALDDVIEEVKGRGVGAVPLPNLPGFRLPEMPTELPSEASDLIENAPTPMVNPVAGATLGSVRDTFSKPENEQQKRQRVAATAEVQMLEQLLANKDLRPEIRPVVQRAYALAKSGQPSGMTENDVLALLRPAPKEQDDDVIPPKDRANVQEATGRPVTRWSELQPGDAGKIQAWEKKYRGTDRVIGVGGGMNDGQIFRAESTIGNEFNRATTASTVTQQQVGVARAGYKEYLTKHAKEGPQGPSTQAMIMAFGKVLDPNSVVRESEYNRSAEMQSLFNRWDAFREKITNGGILAKAEVDAMMDAVEAVSKSYASAMVDQARKAAHRIEGIPGADLRNALTPSQIDFLNTADAEDALRGRAAGDVVTVRGQSYVLLPNGTVVKR